MLKYTGHPFVDVGIATITAFAGKRDPSQITENDLEKVVEYITREYVRQPLKSFLTVAFPNSGFTQPAFEKNPEKRLEYARRVLNAYNDDAPKLDERCVFTGEPAIALAFGEKLPKGRAFRQHIPLLTGENVINFHPYGDSGLPISGKAMLAIQAFPLGCAKCSGRLLAVYSDNANITLYFAKHFLENNRRAIHLAQETGSSKMEEPPFSRNTLLVNTLCEADIKKEDEQPSSITAYHLSNSGQGASLDIYYFPLQMLAFLRDMKTVVYKSQWDAIVRRAWEVESQKQKKKDDEQKFQPSRNWLYEDLFGLPGNARIFLRTYFLRQALRYAKAERGDPRGGYSLKDEISLVSWDITARFLWRILNMDKERIEQIRKMGDQLADYVSTQNDRRFFREFYTESRYDYLRNSLIKANLSYTKRGNKPFLTFDPYIEVFEEGNELARPDWRLARDLVLIRMVECLHEKGWFVSNADVIPDQTEESGTPNN